MVYMEVRAMSECPVCGQLETYFPDVPCVICCPECKRLDREAVFNSSTEARLNNSIHLLWEHIKVFHKRISKSHAGNGVYQGRFAFTLTKSPNDNLTEADMVAAVKKLMAQKSCPVKEYAWYLEYGDEEAKTHPHIHGMYETESGGRIEAKHFKRAWKIWDEKIRQGFGFRGGYHRPVRLDENYQLYISKGDGEHENSHMLI